MNLTPKRIDTVAELLSQGLRVCEVQQRLGATKGETSSLVREVRRQMGSQAC